jgi:hypothetical protein
MKSDLAKARDDWLNSLIGKQCCQGSSSGQYLENRLKRAFIAGWDARESFEPIERCPHCHLALIPESVRKIWQEKFGSRQKPHYKTKCKLCGKPAGEHYGTDCEQEPKQ